MNTFDIIQYLLFGIGFIYGFIKQKNLKTNSVFTSGIKISFIVTIIFCFVLYIKELFFDLDCLPIVECAIYKSLSIFGSIPIVIFVLSYIIAGLILGIMTKKYILNRKK